MRVRRHVFAALLSSVAAFANAADGGAQSTGAPAPGTEGFLEPDHWARLALRGAAAYGLAPVATTTGLRSVRLSDVRRDLMLAVDAAGAGSEARARLTEALHRIDSDYGQASARGTLFNVRVDGGAFVNRGERLAGLAVASPDGFDYTTPPLIPDSNRVRARVHGFAGFGPVIAGFDITPGSRLSQLDLSLRAGPIDIRAGRQPLSFGPGTDEGLMLGPRSSFDGVSLGTPDPFVLPSFLRKLGGVRASLLVARLGASGEITHPWFAASRISFAPSEAWSVGLNRAAIFGGEGNTPITAKRLLLVLFAETDNADKDSDFENQVASVDIAVRVGGPLALLAYLEYAFDDAGLSFFRVPGILAGLEANRIPGITGIAVGAELTGFGGSCCGHPAWYRHGLLAAGWSDGGRLLGHSLGGHGGEAALTWRVDPGPGGFLASGRLFVRHRSAENVFSPDWRGRSGGGRLRMSLPLSPRLRLEGTGEIDSGAGWSRWRADIALGGWLRSAGGDR